MSHLRLVVNHTQREPEAVRAVLGRRVPVRLWDHDHKLSRRFAFFAIVSLSLGLWGAIWAAVWSVL